MSLSKLSDEKTSLHSDERMKNFLKVLESVLIKNDVEYPMPQYVLRYRDIPTVPRGNLVAVTAKWKNGKTFLCELLCSVFLGNTKFPDIDNNHQEGKVLFFDTEQDISDTVQIRNAIYRLIPEENRQQLELYCLRSLDIISDGESIGRFDFIVKTIEYSKPALVVIDDVTDLIYDFNDPAESQMLVNKLAAVATKHNCAIITVMHQNKGRQDNWMKGHVGTMLYQKASDVFSVTKFESIFACSHTVSRHAHIPNFYFAIQDGVPSQLNEEQTQLVRDIINDKPAAKVTYKDTRLVKDDLLEIFGSREKVPANEMVQAVCEHLGCCLSTAYRIINNTIKDGIISKVSKEYALKL